MEIAETDNRDPTCTRLTLTPNFYVDVDPSDLFFNMVENTFDVDAPPDPAEELGLLEDWIDTLEYILQSRLATNRKV